ncbi:MAG: VCBS repeat-containing protein [Chloroflexi bacterium]|nr:VCBS repeat-containing protein [Chloroflexota bacterium]
MAMKGLPEDRREVFEFLMERGVVNLEWYLRTKIVGVAEAERNDHMMVLKYAYYFCLKDATVTLLRESPVPGEKMPDIEVAIGTGRFYVEVKKFREGSASDPVSKIVHAATIKRSQLRSGEVGFIALHNFDIRLEVAEEGGLTHSHIFAALCELQRRATQNPPAWEELGGVIFAARRVGAGGALAVGFIDADDILDVAVGSTTRIRIFLGLGSFSFMGLPTFFVSGTDLALGHLDGDDNTDLIATNFGSDTLQVHWGNGDGSFTTIGSPMNVGDGPSSVTSANINGDEFNDILVSNSGTDDVSIILGLGVRQFATAESLSVGRSPTQVFVADLDEDGQLDLLTANQGSNDVSVRMGIAGGDFAPVGLRIAEDGTGSGFCDIWLESNFPVGAA